MHLIIGAGIWGCAIARLIAENLGDEALVIDRRSHIGGNSFAFWDDETGVECHKYGSHIFHTSIPRVWRFISRFCSLSSYRHQVRCVHSGKTYPMPINLETINSFYSLALSPEGAKELVRKERGRPGVGQPGNLRDHAIAQVGESLFKAFIEGYTSKQWGQPCERLPASIIKRLPVRHTYDNSYFHDQWQGIPEAGYDDLFKRILDHPRIAVRLNTSFNDIRPALSRDVRIIYTGMPDELFHYQYGPLPGRSLEFEWERLPVQDFQGIAVMNYSDVETPFTRIHEFKHYRPDSKSWQNGKTVICREYPAALKPGGEFFYPVESAENLRLYEKYSALARKNGIILGGRCGKYRYLDMDKAIADALDTFEKDLAGNPAVK